MIRVQVAYRVTESGSPEASNNRSMANILAVQDDVVREISQKLRLLLSGEEKTRLARDLRNNGGAVTPVPMRSLMFTPLSAKGTKP